MTTLIWIGPDTDDHKASPTIDAIVRISDFLCQKLGISLEDPPSNATFQELLLKHRSSLPLPNEGGFGDERIWECLRWFYKHQYFTRVWAIQEVIASEKRLAHIGQRTIEWERLDIVASYLIMDTGFSTAFGFSDSYCWWVATIDEVAKQPKKWVFMLYLVSNFSCKDARDYVYGIRGLMEFERGGELLTPDYSKSVVDVYRDSVEAALTNFRSTDILLYVAGQESPSWVPRWDKPMLFRNPFRFGKPLPFRPAGDTEAEWSIDREHNRLTLSGYVLDTISVSATYYETYFGSEILKKEKGLAQIKEFWERALEMMVEDTSGTTVASNRLEAAAVSFSFGLNDESDPAEASHLLDNFLAYLQTVLEAHTFEKLIPSTLGDRASRGDGTKFGKPVWDFEYPASTFYVTKEGLLGCAATSAQPGDIVFVSLGSTYPFVLRPLGDSYQLKGFSFVDGKMFGEDGLGEKQNIVIE